MRLDPTKPVSWLWRGRLTAVCIIALMILSGWGRAFAGSVLSASELMDRAANLAASEKFVEAAALYQQVWEHHRHSAEATRARFEQGKCLVAGLQYAEALECWDSLKGVMGADECKEQALLETARTRAFLMGDLETGEKLLLDYLPRYPRSEHRWQAEYQLGRIWFRKEEFARAKQQFENFVGKNSRVPVAEQAKQYIQYCQQQLEAARQRRAEAFNPNFQPATGKRAPTVAGVLLAQADAAKQKKPDDHALELYQQLLFNHRMTPEHDVAVIGAAECHLALGDAKKAAAVLEELLRTKPASRQAPPALVLLGRIQLEELDDPRAAEATFTRLSREHRGYETRVPTHILGGIALLCQQKYNSAREVLVGVRQYAGPPDPSQPPTGRDMLIESCDKQQLAAQAAKPPYQTGFGRFYGRLVTADAYFTYQDYEEAAKLYAKVRDAKTGSNESCYALLQYGRCQAYMGNEKEALECYDLFLTKYQDSQWADDAIMRMSVILGFDQRTSKRSYELLRYLYTKYPRENFAPRALYTYGCHLIRSNRLPEALELFNRFIREYPQDQLIHLARGQREEVLEKLSVKEKKK